ncbi:KCTD10 [Bugula neritina]|uniref:KCTD10 n=1 Tax=Bugula neritina TaxID=10212 RepID=A0A7J7J7N7_BUGNE|nr:KCTD10 [Bugula neritina]
MGDSRVVVYPSNSSSSKYVKLNVGGTLHYTTIGTLTKHDNMLRAMFSGRMEVLTDSEGWILIDRCGKHFGLVLSFLRDGSIALPESRREDLLEILTEAKYYCIQHHSDDNILRNIELFDKLSLRFSERILFIKDVLVSNEICLWSFFGNAQKIIDVDCTSIVYGQDKKHTKVEFPEARIYEETLNSLLYENRDSLPDSELMKATMSLGIDGNDRDERERVERGVDRLRRK